jgi:VIT1/CCC1 family predicted Fe2+/Mn2+ transporter
MRISNREWHSIQRIGWLRAAVLGANDGILSTASLVLGVAASHATHSAIVVAGAAGLVAGARRQIPNGPTLRLSARNSQQTKSTRWRNWLGSMLVAA